MRFGVPRVLISDNGTPFTSDLFRDNCKELLIEQRFSSVAHPQTNGQTEVTNRIILSGIKKNLEGARRNWADELAHVMWAYRITPKVSTGETPFAMTYGTEAVIPVETGVLSLRIEYINEELNEEKLWSNLDLTRELREQA